MIPVTVPTSDVNSETAVIVNWYVDDRGAVSEADSLAEVETSKAILDVIAPADGFLLHRGTVGDQVRIAEPLAYVFKSLEELERHVADEAATDSARSDGAQRVTEPARRRAAELHVDLEALLDQWTGLITTSMVETAAEASQPAGGPLPEPLEALPGVRRIALIGAGLGATQVLDILHGDETQQAVAIVDDDSRLWGLSVSAVPVVGGVDRLLGLQADQAIDAAIISISTSVSARARLREICVEMGLPLANAIDSTVRIASDVRLGSGNVICAFCYLGVRTVLGDNNFLSAYNSYDHHNVLGSDISTGPGCMSSGLVTIGDRCRLGTGIFLEPHVELGTGVSVASGAIIVNSVPAGHAVKTRQVTTAVVPVRQA